MVNVFVFIWPIYAVIYACNVIKMAQVISEEEFVRLQTQLIELKNENYTLNERCRKQGNEIANLSQRLQHVDSEYLKALKVIAKSKKMKEVELLLQENDALQLKLQSQEDEFRLQNTTLMQELSTVLNSNEQLEKELKELQMNGIGVSGSQVDLELNNKIQKLEIENEALKKLTGDSQNLNTTLAQIKQKLCDHQHSEADGYELVEVNDHEVSYRKSFGGSSSPDLLKYIQTELENIEKNLPQISALQLMLESEKAEKGILRREIEQLRLSSEAKLGNSGGEEYAKLAEKLKKKQENFQKLHNEKEDMYNEHCKTVSSLTEMKDHEINQLKELNMRLQTQLNNTIQNFQDYKSEKCRIIQDLESKIVNLQSEIDGQAVERLQQLDAERIVLTSKLSDTKSVMEAMQKESFNINEKMKTLKQENEQLKSSLKLLEEEKASAVASLANVTKVADRRKQLIDEMNIKMQTKSDEYQHDVAHLTEKYTQQINALALKLEDEQSRSKEAEVLRQRVVTLENECKSIECARDFLKRQLTSTEEALINTTEHYDKLLAKTRNEHETVMEQITKEHEETVSELNIKLEISDTILRAEYEDKIRRLQQELKDAAEEQKIQDKKRMAVIKDFKRQLQNERKRCEALQERLQEFLNENSQTELYKDVVEVDKVETGSISSWSMMSGGGQSESKDSREDSSRLINGSSQPPSNNVYEQDNEVLVKAVASAQQEKAELEEKLKHLELCNAAMAEDILNKSTIIQHYCMEGRVDNPGRGSVDKITVKRVVDFIRDKGDENLKEMNRRMQRMVEETLFRNVNLQKDLDIMSQEVAKLKAASGTASSIT
ncbi:GRIP1 associated protein 1 [Chamberlinius hualienensis]